MQFFDLGDVESLDGRSHPITATTPVSLVTNSQPANDPAKDVIDALKQNNSSFGVGDFWSFAPKHLGTRVAISVLAIGILLIVAFRLVK